MIRFLKKIFWDDLKSWCDEQLRQEEERRQMLRDNLEAWNELNKDFLEEEGRRIDKELDEKYDLTKVPDPDAYGFDGSPLSR